ncbi:MAG: PAS domain-containing protein [Rhodospirillaceae bacterium]|nr:PAS domain-containing protein [Rhodospirillaceae bacterium]
MMNLAAALLYWVIVGLWLAVLVAIGISYKRSPRQFGSARLLLLVILIDTVRNIAENIYFGVYWGGQFGLFSTEIISPLNNSTYVLLIKLLNVLAGVLVLAVLLRLLPMAVRERVAVEARADASDQQAAMLALALDGAASPILVMDAQNPERPVVFANAAYLQRYGKSKAEVIGAPVDLAATFKDEPKAMAEMATAIQEARAHKVVVQLTHPGGHVTTNEITLQPILDDAGRPVLLTALCNDVTGLQGTANDNAHQREHMVTQMAGAIAHDFNNLLTVMLGSLATARSTLAPSSTEGRAVNLGLAAAERSSRLAKRLLSYSVGNAAEREVADVNAVIENIHLLLTRAVAGSVQVTLNLTSERAVCDVDVGGLEDALMNLVINAGHAMPQGGTVRISTTVERSAAAGPAVAVRVTDTGTGMTPEVRARAFERFYTTKGRGRGSGLGLSLVRDFVEQAGGSIELDSTPGVGTTVTFRLPLVSGGVAADATAAE